MKERDFYAEARKILSGKSSLLVETAHLEALEEKYQSELIRVAHDLNNFTRELLKRN